MRVTTVQWLQVEQQAIMRAVAVLRAIANLEDADPIDTPHLPQALKYRKREGE